MHLLRRCTYCYVQALLYWTDPPTCPPHASKARMNEIAGAFHSFVLAMQSKNSNPPHQTSLGNAAVMMDVNSSLEHSTSTFFSPGSAPTSDGHGGAE